jgi:hypothetical protein
MLPTPTLLPHHLSTPTLFPNISTQQITLLHNKLDIISKSISTVITNQNTILQHLATQQMQPLFTPTQIPTCTSLNTSFNLRTASEEMESNIMSQKIDVLMDSITTETTTPSICLTTTCQTAVNQHLSTTAPHPRPNSYPNNVFVADLFKSRSKYNVCVQLLKKN